MARVRGTREGAAIVSVPDMIAASLVARGEAEYVTDEAAKGGPVNAGKRRGTGTASRRTGRKPSGGRSGTGGSDD